MEGAEGAGAATARSVSFLYVGDHLVGDVYAASACAQCRAVAIVEELEDDVALAEHALFSSFLSFLCTKRWGSFFVAPPSHDREAALPARMFWAALAEASR